MIQHRTLRAFPAVLLLAALFLAGLPAQAQPLRSSGTGLPSVAAFGENGLTQLWSFVSRLWRPAMATKEGMSIDPNGGKGSGGGAPVNPNGSQSSDGTAAGSGGRS
jgi:hypothetical protein